MNTQKDLRWQPLVDAVKNGGVLFAEADAELVEALSSPLPRTLIKDDDLPDLYQCKPRGR